MDAATQAPAPVKTRRHIWPYGLGLLVVIAVAVVAFWNWDWFIPLVNARATAALGRPTTVEHLDVKLGRTTTIILSGVQVANPDGIGNGKPFAQIAKLTAAADVMAYIHSRQIVIPQITIDQPVIEADQDANGKASWTGLSGSSSDSSASNTDPNAGPKLGQLVINDGKAHVALAKLKADVNFDIATRQPNQAPSQIVVDAKGTYAGQPITGQFVGGALLSLRDAADPYPVDLHLANGPTKVALTGTVQNPLNFAGANLKLDLAGPNMALLTPLTGVPIPETPPFSIAGALNYADKRSSSTISPVASAPVT